MYFWIGKISKTIKGKVFIFILKDFFLIWGLRPKILKTVLLGGEVYFLEIVRVEFLKIKNVMLILKM
jgi:hypothetical protein